MHGQCDKPVTVVGHQFITLTVDICIQHGRWAWGTASRGSVSGSGNVTFMDIRVFNDYYCVHECMEQLWQNRVIKKFDYIEIGWHRGQLWQTDRRAHRITTRKAFTRRIDHFAAGVTYIQFPIQFCFSSTSVSQLPRTWFSQFHFHL